MANSVPGSVGSNPGMGTPPVDPALLMWFLQQQQNGGTGQSPQQALQAFQSRFAAQQDAQRDAGDLEAYGATLQRLDMPAHVAETLLAKRAGASVTYTVRRSGWQVLSTAGQVTIGIIAGVGLCMLIGGVVYLLVAGYGGGGVAE